MILTNQNYNISEISSLSLTQKYGTPLYVYDTSKMEEQFNILKNSFQNIKCKINYACKALSNINILKFFESLGAGLDAVSIQEVLLGLKAGYKPENIIFTPNCVSFEEIEEAIRCKVKITIDNLSLLEQFGNKYSSKVPVCIRINPHIMGGGNIKISTGHIDSKFGISIHQVPHLKRIIQANDIKVEGLHMHTGSDILDLQVFLNTSQVMFKIAYEFENLKYIDLGSGFKVKYKENDVSTDIKKLGKLLSEQFDKFCKKYGRKLFLIVEPGKFLVSEAGYFFTKVNVIKQTTSTIFAGLDTGLNHFIRPMFYDSYHRIINVSKPEAKKRIYTIVGYICETDTFGNDRKINELNEDDIVCFRNAGAYCFQMASNYNSRYRPAEVLIHKGKDYLIRKRENMEDLLKNQVKIEI